MTAPLELSENLETLDDTQISRMQPKAGVRLLAPLPSIPLGGMERAALRVLESVAARGAYVHVLTNRRWGERVRREVEAVGLSSSGIGHVHGLGLPRTFVELRAAMASLLMSEHEFAAAHRRVGANALLATSVNVAWFGRRIARRSDTVSVFRIPNPPLFGGSGIKSRLDRAVWRAIGESFDYLVCNSNYTAAIVKQACSGIDKVRIVRNYPPSLKRQIEVPAPPLPPGRRRIVFLGQIAAHKGVDILFAAAQQLLSERDDLDVVLAGPTNWLDTYPQELAARVKLAGLSHRFLLLGSIDDVQGLLRQAHIHVCPSISPGDSFPNVILDAKQAGLPSIVLPTAGLLEAVEHGVDGLVAPDTSANALAAAIASLLDNPARLHRMGEAARASLSRFNPDPLTDSWLELFASKPSSQARRVE